MAFALLFTLVFPLDINHHEQDDHHTKRQLNIHLLLFDSGVYRNRSVLLEKAVRTEGGEKLSV